MINLFTNLRMKIFENLAKIGDFQILANVKDFLSFEQT